MFSPLNIWEKDDTKLFGIDLTLIRNELDWKVELEKTVTKNRIKKIEGQKVKHEFCRNVVFLIIWYLLSQHHSSSLIGNISFFWLSIFSIQLHIKGGLTVFSKTVYRLSISCLGFMLPVNKNYLVQSVLK